jgi:hypothetical protein
MDATTADAGSGLLNNSLELASWNRERSLDELRRFVAAHHAVLPADINIE